MFERVLKGIGLGRRAPGTEAVGVDLGSRLIKLMQVRALGDHAEVVCWGAVPTPEGAIVDGMIRDSEEVAYVLRRLVYEKGLAGQPACAALPARCARIECASIPVPPGQSAAAAAAAALEQRLGETTEPAVGDCTVLDHDPGGGTAEVAFVTASAQSVYPRAEVLAKARLEPVALEVEPFALLCSLVESVEDPLGAGLSVVVDMGGATLDLMALESGRFIASRTAPAPGEAAAACVTVRQMLEAAREEQAALGRPWQPKRVALCGGLADPQSVAPMLESELGLPVESGDVFRGGRLRDGLSGAAGARESGPLLAIAAGLSLRGALLSGRLKRVESPHE
jgi:Tfp pilus assembly PilM family ATPase